MDIQAELSKFQPGSKERVLLEKVLDKLGPNFAQKSLLQQAKEAQQKRDDSMQKYFKKKIVEDAVNKAVAEQELVQLESDSFQKLVFEKLKGFFIEFIECTGGTVEDGDWRKSFDKTVKGIQNKIDFHSVSKRNVHESRKQLKDTIMLYYKVIGNSLMMLNNFLSLHQDKLDFESQTSEFYMLRSYALSLKSELFHMKLSLATYNLKTIPALSHISSELNRKEESLKVERQTTTVALDSYSMLGKEFDEIVDEILQLTKAIEEEEYSIDQLERHMLQLNASTNE